MRPGFTGSLLDRADHVRLDEHRVRALASSPEARLVRLAGSDPEIDAGGRLLRDPVTGASEQLIFLGFEGEAPLFAAMSGDGASSAFALADVLARMSAEDGATWAAARSLIEWHRRHRFCANCGAVTRAFRAGWGRRCLACDAQHFPRVDPVVIMLAQHDDAVLLARQPHYPPGRYSALAGFVEPGESIEEAVARELHEEVGIKVANVRYACSQPWPFPSSLMIACIADAAAREILINRTELEHALWVDRSGVAAALAGEAGAPFLAPPSYAIAHSLLGWWLERSDRLAGEARPA